MRLNTLSPAPGRVKEVSAVAVVSVAALVKLAGVAIKVKKLELEARFVQVLRVVKCRFKNVCQNMVSHHV